MHVGKEAITFEKNYIVSRGRRRGPLSEPGILIWTWIGKEQIWRKGQCPNWLKMHDVRSSFAII